MSKGTTTRTILLSLTVLLVVALAAVLYVLLSVMNSPEQKPVTSNQPGVVYKWQALGGSFGSLDHPGGVAFDGDNRIYVTESNASKILVFDKQGNNGRVFVEEKDTSDAHSKASLNVSYPMGIDVAPDGTVFVADADKNAVVVFNKDGKKLREMPFDTPTQVTVAGEKMYVASNATLYVCDMQGNKLGQYGTWGQGLDQFSGVSGITVDSKGRIYVTDMNNYRVLALSPGLERLWQTGAAVTTEAQENSRSYGGPSGVTIGEDGNVYFLDGISSKIYVLSKDGKVISDALSSRGNADDQLYLPKDIKYVGDGTFVIADTFHNRIVGLELHPQPLKTK